MAEAMRQQEERRRDDEPVDEHQEREGEEHDDAEQHRKPEAPSQESQEQPPEAAREEAAAALRERGAAPDADEPDAQNSDQDAESRLMAHPESEEGHEDAVEGQGVDEAAPEDVSALVMEREAPEALAALEQEAPEPLQGILGQTQQRAEDAVVGLNVNLSTTATASTAVLKGAGRKARGMVSAAHGGAKQRVAAAGEAVKGQVQALGTSAEATMLTTRLQMTGDAGEKVEGKKKAMHQRLAETRTAGERTARSTGEDLGAQAGAGAKKLRGWAGEVAQKYPSSARGESRIRNANMRAVAKKQAKSAARAFDAKGTSFAQGYAKTQTAKTASFVEAVKGATDTASDGTGKQTRADLGAVGGNLEMVALTSRLMVTKKVAQTAELTDQRLDRSDEGSRRRLRRTEKRLQAAFDKQARDASTALKAADKAMLATAVAELQELVPVLRDAENSDDPASAEAALGYLKDATKGLLETKLAELAAMYAEVQDDLVGLGQDGAQQLQYQAKGHRKSAGRIAARAVRSLKTLGEAFQSSSVASTTSHSTLLTELMNRLDADLELKEQAVTPHLKQHVTHLQNEVGIKAAELNATLSAHSAALEGKVRAKAAKLAQKSIARTHGKAGRLKSAVMTEDEKKAASAVRGLRKEEAGFLRDAYPGPVQRLRGMDESSERSEALAWVRGRRGKAIRIALVRDSSLTGYDPEALEETLRTLTPEEMPAFKEHPMYDVLHERIHQRADGHDHDTHVALLDGDVARADAIRTHEALEDGEDGAEKAAELIQKYAGDKEKLKAFDAKFEHYDGGGTPMGRTLALMARAKLKGSHRDLVTSAQADDKAGMQAARVDIAFEDGGYYEQHKALQDTELAEARKNPDLSSKDPKKKAAAKARLAKAEKFRAEVDQKYKDRYGLGAVGLKERAAHAYEDKGKDDHVGRLVRQSAAEGDASRGTKILAASKGIGTHEALFKEGSLDMSKEEVKQTNKELGHHGTSIGALAEDELGGKDEHQVRMDSLGKPENADDYAKRAKMEAEFHGASDWTDADAKHYAAITAMGWTPPLDAKTELARSVHELNAAVVEAKKDGKLDKDEEKRIRDIARRVTQDGQVVQAVKEDDWKTWNTIIDVAGTLAAAAVTGGASIAVTALTGAIKIGVKGAIMGNAMNANDFIEMSVKQVGLVAAKGASVKIDAGFKAKFAEQTPALSDVVVKEAYKAALSEAITTMTIRESWRRFRATRLSKAC